MSTRKCPHESCQCNLRILIVENDQRFGDDHEKNLSLWGYLAVRATGRGPDLLESAKELARKHRCHLAIVDMRLMDDEENYDRSGLDLVKELLPTRSIIVTGYGNLKDARDALMVNGAFDIIGKQVGPRELKEASQRAAAECCPNSLHIEWPAKWSSERVVKSLSVNDDAPLAQATLAISTLFPDAQHIKLEYLSSPAKPLRNLLRSVLFTVSEDGKLPVVLKMVRNGKAEREHNNYTVYIDKQLEGGRYAHLEKYVDLWDIGAIVYSFVGNKDGVAQQFAYTFTQFYAEQSDVATIFAPLETAFDKLWAKHYGNQNPMSTSIIKAYDGVSKNRLEEQVHKWQSQLAEYDPFCVGMSFPEPRYWLATNANYCSLPTLRECVIHGDFHGENILVDSDGYPWLIDFGRTRIGHAFSDFAEIIQYILTKLANKCDIYGFYELVISSLCDFKQENGAIPLSVQQCPDSMKAYGVVCAVKQKAMQIADSNDIRELLWGILLDSLYVHTVLPKGSTIRHARLLLLASILCQRLDSWELDEWMPQSWPTVQYVEVTEQLTLEL